MCNSKDRVEIIRERWADAPKIDETSPRIIMINRAIWDEALTAAPTDIQTLLAEVDRLRGGVECAIDHINSDLPMCAAEGLQRMLDQ